MLYQDPDRDDCQRLIDISRLPIDQLFIEWEKFRVEFFSNATEDNAFAIYVPVPRPDLQLIEESIRGNIFIWSDRMTPSRAIWVTDVLAHLHRRLRINEIDDQLTALPYVDECVWYQGEWYGGIGPFIDACIESGDDFYESVLGSVPLPFKFIDAHSLAINCWRHMTEQAEDSDRITAEELFDEAVIDYQYLAEFEFEIEPKGLGVLNQAIEGYCHSNAYEWRLAYEDIKAPGEGSCAANKRELAFLAQLLETSSFKALADALAKVEALYKEDEKLFDEGTQTIGLTEEWWISKGWKRGEV